MGCSCFQAQTNLQLELKIQNDDLLTEMSTPNNIEVNQIKIQTPFFVSPLKLKKVESKISAIQYEKLQSQAHKVISPIMLEAENDIQSSENTAKEIIGIMTITSPQLKCRTQSKSISSRNKKKKVNMKQLEDQF